MKKLAGKLVIVALIAGWLAARDPYAGTPDQELRAGVIRAAQAKDHRTAVAMTEALIARRVALLEAGESAVEALLRDGQVARAGQLLVAGMRGPRVVKLAQLAHRQLRNEDPAERALIEPLFSFLIERDPNDAGRRVRYANLLASRGRVDDARAQCKQAIALEPDYVAARNLMWKLSHAVDAKESTTKRAVHFTARVKKGQVAYLAGSWNARGQAEQLKGWKREAMTPGACVGGDVVWTATRSLEPGEDWYAALVATSADPEVPAIGMARFPVYAIAEGDVRVDLNQEAIEPAHPLFAPRAARVAKKAERAPRTVLLCVDGATWKVLMPMVRAGQMPRTAALMKGATVCELRSPYPITIPAFNLVNLGVAQLDSMWDIMEGAIEVLKENHVVGEGVGDGRIKGRANLWKALGEQGVSTLYTALSEQLSYDRKGNETVHRLALDSDRLKLAGAPATKASAAVAAFLPEAERARGTHALDYMVEFLYADAMKRHYQSLQLMRETGADVTLMHSLSVDASFHWFWSAMEDNLTADGAKGTRYRKVVEQCHRQLDVMLGEIVDELDLSRDNLIVWSDHGARGGLVKQSLGHDDLGIGIFAGPKFRSGQVVDGRPELSRLAPTLCAALGVASPASHAASPIAEVLAPHVAAQAALGVGAATNLAAR